MHKMVYYAMSGTLFIVATPIGNLADITYRAVSVLKTVDLILAEDTRKTRILLTHYDIENNILSYHSHSDFRRFEEVGRYLLEGKHVALVTDAGTPGISDPGNELISYLSVLIPDIQVVPIPGASSLISLASVCGLNVSKFVFLGFLPKKKLQKELKWVLELELPFFYFDSPYRALKNIELIRELGGKNLSIVVGRELTKKFEEILRGTIDEVIEKVKETDPRGEYVVLVSKTDSKLGHSGK